MLGENFFAYSEQNYINLLLHKKGIMINRFQSFQYIYALESSEYSKTGPDLFCPNIPGPSIYRASILSSKNKLYVWINANCAPIYRAPRFTGPNSFPQEAR